MKKESLEEEKRLDEMMEIERLKALKEYEEREKLKHLERLKGAQVIQQQIKDNEQQRHLDEERKDQETVVSYRDSIFCILKLRLIIKYTLMIDILIGV